jgi:hypothetical protein
MHNPFSTYSDTRIMHNPGLCKMCVTDSTECSRASVLHYLVNPVIGSSKEDTVGLHFSKIEEIFFNLRSPKIDPRFSVGIVKFYWAVES